MHNFIRQYVLALLIGFSAGGASAEIQTIYVAPGGDDALSGSIAAPLRSVSAAVEKSRHIRGSRGEECRILLAGGIYPLTEPLELTGRDSGLLIESAGADSPVISGQTVIRGWQRSPVNPNIWQTEIPEAAHGAWIFHELFVNGQRKSRTRFPADGYFSLKKAGIAEHPDELRFHPGEIRPEWSQPGDVELVTITCWAETRNVIRSVSEPLGIVALAGKALAWQNGPDDRFYIENAPIELRPGQWHLDAAPGLLTYWPEAGEDMRKAVITVPHVYTFVRMEGHADNLVRNITLRGLTFADADWKLEDGSDYDMQGAVEVPGAVRAQFARHCSIERCTFQRLGGYAVELDGGCEEDNIIGNNMFDLGAGGVRIGESKMDRANQFPCGHHLVSDNHIHHIGLVQMPGMGILALLTDHNLIAHNEIDHTYQTAISVGWSWGYAVNPCHDNIVEYNLIHDIGQGQTSDMGGVYTLGVQPATIVRNNLIHDINYYSYGAWGLYTDEGSSGIVLENNVVYRCQSAGFQQHYGRTNIFRNNIFACNKNAQLDRTRIEPQLSFTFTNNIVYLTNGPLFSGRWGDDVQMDHNIYFDTRSIQGNTATMDAIRAWQKRGHDLHSLFIDPMFVAPRHNNFRLKPNSPAIAFGFKPIDLTDVGVRPRSRQPDP